MAGRVCHRPRLPAALLKDPLEAGERRARCEGRDVQRLRRREGVGVEHRRRARAWPRARRGTRRRAPAPAPRGSPRAARSRARHARASDRRRRRARRRAPTRSGCPGGVTWSAKRGEEIERQGHERLSHGSLDPRQLRAQGAYTRAASERVLEVRGASSSTRLASSTAASASPGTQSGSPTTTAMRLNGSGTCDASQLGAVQCGRRLEMERQDGIARSPWPARWRRAAPRAPARAGRRP